MDIISSLAPLSSAILITSIILNVFLGYVVFRSDTKSATNRLFALLAMFLSLWMVVFYISLEPLVPNVTLWWIRWSLFVTVPVNTLFFLLAYTFPNNTLGVSKGIFYSSLVGTLLVCLLTISPYTFTSVRIINNFPVPLSGGGLQLFAIFVLLTNLATVYKMSQRYNASEGTMRTQIGYLLVGTVSFLVLMFGSVLVPTLVFQNVSTVPLAPLYTFLFIATTTYASFRHQLFSVKVIATQSFVTILCIVFFVKIFTGVDPSERFIDFVIFICTLSFGILLVRSVEEEIRARVQVADLAKRLTSTNWELARTNEQLRIIDQRKSEFVSIVSHQLRTPITAIKGYASLVLEDSFGKIPDSIKSPIEKIFISSTRLSNMVSDFLDISKIEQGTMSYNFASVDIAATVSDLVDEFTTVATQKNLQLYLTVPKNEPFIVTADEGKVRQILSNLIDNSIKYTPAGSVHISLEKDNVRGMIIIKLKDTGIGLSHDDIHHLFGKFTRGSGGQKQNTDGSGLGLYVAKKMLEAHNGTIWVDSPGTGKGSTFIIELLAEE